MKENKDLERVLKMVELTLKNKEVVTDHDIDEWLTDESQFDELMDLLSKNKINAKYDKELDTYVYDYESDNEEANN